MAEQTPPFHRLLYFYANRSPTPDTETIRFGDSLRANLALGLDFPVALVVAIGRHLLLRNTGFPSLNIHVPSVATRTTLLDGVPVDEKKSYTSGEIARLAKAKHGWAGYGDALGVWMLAAGTQGEGKGLLKGEDVVAFQRGTLLETLERRRKGRGEVLPLWRGGPISATGHSWAVGTIFGVEVYRKDWKGD